MATDRRIGRDWQFYRSTDGTTYTQIADVVGAIDNEVTREVGETTILADTFATKRVGVIDPGELSLTLVNDPTGDGFSVLEGDFTAGTYGYYRVQARDLDGSSHVNRSFRGYVTSLNLNTGDRVELSTADITITLSGDTGL